MKVIIFLVQICAHISAKKQFIQFDMLCFSCFLITLCVFFLSCRWPKKVHRVRRRETRWRISRCCWRAWHRRHKSRCEIRGCTNPPWVRGGEPHRRRKTGQQRKVGGAEKRWQRCVQSWWLRQIHRIIYRGPQYLSESVRKWTVDLVCESWGCLHSQRCERSGDRRLHKVVGTEREIHEGTHSACQIVWGHG